MNHKEIISELGRMVGLESLKLEDDKGTSVYFDDDEIVFEQTAGRLFVIAPIGPIEGHEDMFRTFLLANHLGADSALGSIGIDDLQDEYTLTRVFEGEFQYDEFEKSLLLFIRTLRKWKTILEEGKVSENIENTPSEIVSVMNS